MPQTHQTAFEITSANAPLEKLLDHVIDPFIALHRQGPGLEALLTGSVISEELTTTIHALNQHVEASLARLFQARRPRTSYAQINRAAATSVQLFKTFLHSAVTGTPKQQRESLKELKTVLYRYLAPILGE